MLRIRKASAGSGKTFTLARQYITLLLGHRDRKTGRMRLYTEKDYGFLKPKPHARILAITFTKKATQEMTDRIIAELALLANWGAESFESAESFARKAGLQAGGEREPVCSSFGGEDAPLSFGGEDAAAPLPFDGEAATTLSFGGEEAATPLPFGEGDEASPLHKEAGEEAGVNCGGDEGSVPRALSPRGGGERKAGFQAGGERAAGGCVRSAHLDYLCEVYSASAEQIAEAARRALADMLFNFSSFNVSTIDSFFQNVLRIFTRELDLPEVFNLEIDENYPVAVAVGEMFSSINLPVRPDDKVEAHRQRMLKAWMQAYMDSLLEEGENANLLARSSKVNRQLVATLSGLRGETYKSHRAEIQAYLSDPERIERFAGGLAKSLDIKRRRLVDASRAFMNTDEADLLPKLLREGTLQRWATEDFSYDPTDKGRTTLASALDNESKRHNKPKKGQPEWSEEVDRILVVILQMGVDFFATRRFHEILRRQIYLLGLFSHSERHIEDYCRENEAFLLGDTNLLLRRVICDAEAPFVYERIGTTINHFLIDEFQDTSEMQWENLAPLLRESMSRHQDNLIIGDEKQCIYRFRNSKPELLGHQVEDAMTETFGGDAVEVSGTDVRDNTNWRSRRNVVEFNNFLFRRLAILADEGMARPLAVPTYSGLIQQVAEKNLAPGVYPGYVKVLFSKPVIQDESFEGKAGLQTGGEREAAFDRKAGLQAGGESIGGEDAAAPLPFGVGDEASPLHNAGGEREATFDRKAGLQAGGECIGGEDAAAPSQGFPAEEQLDCLWSEINRQLDSGYRPGDIAILVRRHSEGERIISYLMTQMHKKEWSDAHPALIPIMSDDALEVSSSPSVQLIVGILRLCTTPQYIIDDTKTADEAVKDENRILNPAYLRNRLIHRYALCAVDLPPHEALEEAVRATTPRPGDPALDDLQRRLDAVIMDTAEMDCPSLFAIVERIIRECLPESSRTEDAAFLTAFQDLVLDFEEKGDADIDSFLQWWDSKGCSRTLPPPEGMDALRVMTIHQAKGLEMPCVHVPFCESDIYKLDGLDWYSLDTNGFGGIAPEDVPPLIPLRGSARFADIPMLRQQFETIKQTQMIDCLNVMYVAFTRAVDELIIYSNPDKRGDHFGKLLFKALDEVESGEWESGYPRETAIQNESFARKAGLQAGGISHGGEDAAAPLSFGGEDVTAPLPFGGEDAAAPLSFGGEDATAPLPFGGEASPLHSQGGFDAEIDYEGLLATYPSYRPADMALTDDIEQQGVFDPDDERHVGNFLHDALAHVRTVDDLPQAVARAAYRRSQPKEYWAPYLAKLQSALSDPRVRNWYEGYERLMNERPLTAPEGLRRPDRVVFHPDGTISVIDYKFGSPTDTYRSKYRDQVRDYMSLLAGCGYRNLRGYLFYPLAGEILSVD